MEPWRKRLEEWAASSEALLGTIVFFWIFCLIILMAIIWTE